MQQNTTADTPPPATVIGQPVGAAMPVQAQMQVVVPPGACAGQNIMVTTPTGQQLKVKVPYSAGPGQMFLVALPAAAPDNSMATPTVTAHPVAHEDGIPVQAYAN